LKAGTIVFRHHIEIKLPRAIGNTAMAARLPLSERAMLETPILFLIAFLVLCAVVWWFW
jgi:hypothetical protein